MISIETPPQDPSDQIFSHLRKSSSSSVSDEKASNTSASASDHKLGLGEEVDLVELGPDETNPLPKFTIRDYVFGSRSKDITVNWPFSRDVLLVCLEHGVKNLLPPFQSLDSLRNPFLADENSLPGAKHVTSNDEEPSPPSCPFVSLDSSGAKFPPEVASNSADTNSSKSKKGTEFQPFCEAELLPANISLQALKEKPVSEISAGFEKQETKIPAPEKKRKLVVKLNPSVELVSVKEDYPLNHTVTMETAASKVCPVCKTFSSSSNTTLNAHIDQCLSGGSTMKWNSTNSKAITHKIKPRKTRLMVDIYKTAPYCTLEELDRRNGTSWASGSSFPAEEIESRVEKEDKKLCTGNVGVPDREGAVYIDTNGTKVRILSVPVLGTGAIGHGSQIPPRGGKGSKCVTMKKKRRINEKKHNTKFQSLAHHSKEFCSPNPRPVPEVQRNPDNNNPIRDPCKKDDGQSQQLRAKGRTNDAANVRPWVCSKRTDRANKSASDGNKNDLIVEGHFPSILGSFKEKTGVLVTPSSSGNPTSSESSKKLETCSSYETESDGHDGQPFLRRKVDFPPKCKEVTFLGDSLVCTPDYMKHHMVCTINRTVEINAEPSKNSNSVVFGSKAKNFSSLRENLSSVSQDSITAKRRLPKLAKSSANFVLSDKAKMQNTAQQQPKRMSFGISSLLKNRKGKQSVIGSEKEKPVPHSPLPPQKNINFSVPYVASLENIPGDGESAGNNAQTRDERNVCDGSFFNLSKLACPSTEGQAPPFSIEKSLDDSDGMFCSGDMGNALITGQKAHRNSDISGDMGGGNYYAEVDPIPIPGPPGSFLPSPGRDIVSEEVQGHSSLTNGRVQSSEENRFDHRDAMSGSPVSATSTISDPTLPRSDSNIGSKNYALVSKEPKIEAERTSLYPWKAAEMIMEKVSFGFKNDQLCCCSRKEGAPSQNQHQESALLRRRVPDSRKRPSSLNLVSESFSVSNCPPPGPEKLMKSLATDAPLMTNVFSDSEAKFHMPSHCDSASASSNPILRLMGKNLLVVKKDEERAPQLKIIHPTRSVKDQLNGEFHAGSGFSPRNIQSNCQAFPQLRPIIYSQNQNILKFQNVEMPNGFRSCMDLKTSEVTTMTSSLASDFVSSVNCYGLVHSRAGPITRVGPHNDADMDPHEYRGDQKFQTELARSKSRLDIPLACDRNAYSCSKQDIIVIDDSREKEPECVAESSSKGCSRNRLSSSSIHILEPCENGSANVNHFYNQQSCFGASFQIPPSGELHSAKWSHVPGGPSYQRPGIYYPPSFS